MSSDCQPGDSGSPLSRCSVRIGLTFVAQSACLSFIAVVSLLAYVSYIAFKNRHTEGWRFFRSHLDLYLLGLLSSDLIQSIGGIMDIKWIAIAGIRQGSFCTAQGVLEQFGDVGVALCSLAIAVHTFADIILRWKEPASLVIPLVVLGLYVIFLTLIIGVGYAAHRNSTYYGDTTYWCWITPRFLKEGIGLEYLWLWIAALANLVLYVPVFFVLKGFIIVEPSEGWLRYRVRRTRPTDLHVSPEDKDVVNPRRMLFYPAVYIVTVLPIAITRISSLAHPHNMVPFPATIFSGVLFSASGIFNVIVFTSTRPALLRPPATIPDVRAEPKSHPKAPQLFWSDADQSDARSTASVPTPQRTGRSFEMNKISPPTNLFQDQDHDTAGTMGGIHRA